MADHERLDREIAVHYAEVHLVDPMAVRVEQALGGTALRGVVERGDRLVPPGRGPERLQGRINSVYRLASWGGSSLGAAAAAS